MADAPTPRFDPFPELGGVGWGPAVAMAAAGAGAAGPIMLLLVVPEVTAGAPDPSEIGLGIAVVVGALIAWAVGPRLSRVARRRAIDGTAIVLAAVVALLAVPGLPEWLVAPAPALWAFGIVFHRVTLVDAYPRSGWHRVLGLYWSGAAVGAAIPLFVAALRPDDWTIAVFASAGVILLGALVPAVGSPAEPAGVGTVRVPWGRRSAAIAGVLGFLVFGAGPAGLELLGEVFELSSSYRLALVGAGLLGVVAIGLFGHWYHRFGELPAEALTDAVGIQLVVVAILVAGGALAEELTGIVLVWLGAIATVGLVLVTSDIAANDGLTTAARTRLAVRQVVAFAVGGGIAVWLADGWLGGQSLETQAALAAVPVAAVGLVIGRGARSQRRMRPKPAEAVAPPDETSLLRLAGVDASYGNVQVLFGVELEVAREEIVAVLGTNGAGKTTTLRTIARLHDGTSRGVVRLAGIDITDYPATWVTGLGVCHIAGSDSLAMTLTVEENLRMFAHTLGTGADFDELLGDAFELFPRLEERRRQRASTLSGGEKQMLALAKAVIQRPRLLLIDEFSLGLAPIIVQQLLPVIEELRSRGAAIVLVEQNVSAALTVADRAYVMEGGRMVWQGDAATLRDDPALVEAIYLEGIVEALG
jgi:ABC-type branched-subunit amino acid transport system ATPase component